MGKGSKRRPENKNKIDKNWDKIFKKKNVYKVLDACCGCKMMWFDKYNENVLFADKRFEEKDMSIYTKNFGKKTLFARFIALLAIAYEFAAMSPPKSATSRAIL